jgi:DNA sulfur modification protein DndB
MATRPVIVGKMGSTTFYETTMTAHELAASVRAARETDDWATASIDERIQRDVNVARVKNSIVPYLANHPDRFFGSFIILARADTLTFEPLSDIVGKLPAAYANAIETMGFLTMSGRGELVALDGQHRLLALREVITNAADLGAMASRVGDDELCVLIIEFESAVKTRRIFNKVNRNAKPTGKSDNIITSEDDGFAIVARRLLDNDFEGPLASRETETGRWEMVEWTQNSLTRSTERLTTISEIYEIVKDVLTSRGHRDFSEKESPVAPPEVALQTATEVMVDWFNQFLSMSVLREFMLAPSSIPGIRYSTTDPRSLLLRPVGQIAVALGLVRSQEIAKDFSSATLKALVDRIPLINWSASPGNYWRDVLVKPDGRMIARKESYDLAADLVAYMISPRYSEEARDGLWRSWNKARGRDPFTPVDQLEDDQVPEDLPAQVVDGES